MILLPLSKVDNLTNELGGDIEILRESKIGKCWIGLLGVNQDLNHKYDKAYVIYLVDMNALKILGCKWGDDRVLIDVYFLGSPMIHFLGNVGYVYTNNKDVRVSEHVPLSFFINILRDKETSDYVEHMILIIEILTALDSIHRVNGSFFMGNSMSKYRKDMNNLISKLGKDLNTLTWNYKDEWMWRY